MESCLVIQGLRRLTSIAGVTGSILGWGTKILLQKKKRIPVYPSGCCISLHFSWTLLTLRHFFVCFSVRHWPDICFLKQMVYTLPSYLIKLSRAISVLDSINWPCSPFLVNEPHPEMQSFLSVQAKERGKVKCSIKGSWGFLIGFLFCFIVSCWFTREFRWRVL